MHVHCPHCRSPVEMVDEHELRDVICPNCGSSFNLLPDDTITRLASVGKSLGHFRLMDRIGVGAFGEVWTAHDTELDRTVALKLPRKGHLSSEEAESFLREARSAARLSHPGIVAVHEVGKAGEQLFIVSDYVRGVTLADWLTGASPTPTEAATLVAQLADAVQHAHDHGVIHRDLKPSNIMLDAASQPHIMDFGLAKREAGEITMTMDGKVLGTPAYMSPEQARGSAHDADSRSDVYSLGVILFELITGELPFRGNPRMMIHQVINEDAPALRLFRSSVPRDLETICSKCLEKAPAKRYQSAQGLAADLRRFTRGEPVEARRVTRFEHTWRWCRRNPVVASLAALVVLLLILGMTISSFVALVARERAEENRRRLYISHMNIAQRAWEDGNAKRVEALLKQYDRTSGVADLRQREWYYLWRELRRSLQRSSIAVNEMPISLALAGDHRTGLLATGHSGGTVNLWHLHDSRQVDPVEIRNRGFWFCTFVRFSPDGKTLAFPNRDNSQVVLLNVESHEQRELSGYSGFINTAAFSPDGRLLAAAGPNGMVAIWDPASARPPTVFVVDGVGDMHYTKRAVAFSPDSRLLAVGTTDGVIEIWDTKEQQLKTPFKTTAIAGSVVPADRRMVWAVEFSPDGMLLAGGLGDGSVKQAGRVLGDGRLGVEGRGWERTKLEVPTHDRSPKHE